MMTLGEIVLGALGFSAALVLTAVTVGPAYFVFKMLPEIERALRHAHSVETRREKRKLRAAKRWEQEQLAQTLIKTISQTRGV